jgi:small nuclear ribonucleoprotein (snRNP)-like protein
MLILYKKSTSAELSILYHCTDLLQACWEPYRNYRSTRGDFFFENRLEQFNTFLDVLLKKDKLDFLKVDHHHDCTLEYTNLTCNEINLSSFFVQKDRVLSWRASLSDGDPLNIIKGGAVPVHRKGRESSRTVVGRVNCFDKDSNLVLEDVLEFELKIKGCDFEVCLYNVSTRFDPDTINTINISLDDGQDTLTTGTGGVLYVDGHFIGLTKNMLVY